MRHLFKVTFLLVTALFFIETAAAWERWHKYSDTGIRIDYSRVRDIDTGAFLTIMRKWSEDTKLFIVTGDRFICSEIEVDFEIDKNSFQVEGIVLANRFAIELASEKDWLEVLSDKQNLLIQTKDSCGTETRSDFDISKPIFVRSAPK